jgi:hypothetical protein
MLTEQAGYQYADFSMTRDAGFKEAVSSRAIYVILERQAEIQENFP